MGEHQHEQIKERNKTEGSHKGNEATTSRPAQPLRIAAAPKADFGDLMVDETAFREIHIFNQDRDLAFLDAHIEGGDAFQITRKPNHVNPSANGFDPTSAIRVAYMSRSRKVDRGFLVATLRWRDGTSESIRIALHGAAHRSNELTHEDEHRQTEARIEQQTQAKERQQAAGHEEQRIRAEEAKGGSHERVLDDAAQRLANRLDNLFEKQAIGVTEAAAKVAMYKRRPPPPPPPDIVKELAFMALDMASGKLVSLVTAGINAAGAGWTKGTPGEEGYGWSDPGKPGTKEVSVSPAGPVLGFVIGKLLAKGVAGLKAAPSTVEDAEGSSVAESRIDQLDYFALQAEVVANKKHEAKDNAIDIKRSLIHLDNPRDAPKAAEMLRKAGEALAQHHESARSVQAVETMKGWIRHVSHSALGSVRAESAERQGLKKTKDETSTAQIDQAHAARPYDGVIELEFDANANQPGAAVRVATARLFGVSAAAAASLGLTKKALRTSGLPIRARSTASSSPVHVSIARDEAGNVRFTDESGAVGMPSPWLSGREGRAGSQSAAQRAAKNLIEDIAGKTLTQLNVTLETDGTDV